MNVVPQTPHTRHAMLTPQHTTATRDNDLTHTRILARSLLSSNQVISFVHTPHPELAGTQHDTQDPVRPSSTTGRVG